MSGNNLGRRSTAFPSIAEAGVLIPTGRQPYVMAREVVLSERTGALLDARTVHTIGVVAAAHRNGVLEPSLSPEIADAVERADGFIDEARKPVSGFDYEAARVILDAVFEHGYKSDGA